MFKPKPENGPKERLVDGRRAGLILALALAGAFGSGCTSVEKSSTQAVASDAASAPKGNDFYSIMSRMNATTHAAPRQPREQPAQLAAVASSKTTNNTGAVSCVLSEEVERKLDGKPAINPFISQPKLVATTTPIAPTTSIASATTAPQAQEQLASASTVASPLIVTNHGAQPDKATGGDLAAVMTVKARGVDDDGDHGVRTSYAGAASHRTEAAMAAAVEVEGGSWVRRSVLSVSVGCLGVGAFLLRMIRLGRFTARVVSGGLQTVTKLRV
jgi:hypothetical protein